MHVNEWVVEIGTFIVQACIVVAVIGISVLLIARAKAEGERDLTLHVEPLHERRRSRARRLRLAATPAGIRKSYSKRSGEKINIAVKKKLILTLPMCGY